jgi:hypothetical protein
MSIFIKFISGILICMQIFVYGCANLDHKHDVLRQHYRDADYPVGIAYSTYEPEIKFDFSDKVAGGIEGASSGALHGLQCDIFFFICVPLFSVTGAATGAVAADSYDVAEFHKGSLQQSMAKNTQSLYSQELLANKVHSQLSLVATDSPILINSDVINDIDGADNYRTLLKVTLQEINFKGMGWINDPICLYMLASATKYSAATGRQLDTLTTKFYGQCMSYIEWGKEGGQAVIQEIETGYEALAENIAEELFLVYLPSLSDIASEEDSERVVPRFALAPISTKPNKPVILSNIFDKFKFLGNVQPANVENLTPMFRWEAFPRDFDDFTISDSLPENVTYEFRLYDVGLIGSGIDYRVIPSRILHAERDLRVNYYPYPNKLEPCHLYFWTVRAKFTLNGYPRVTEWSGVYDVPGYTVNKDPSYRRRHATSSRSVNVHRSQAYPFLPFRTGVDVTKPCQNDRIRICDYENNKNICTYRITPAGE